MTRKTLGNYSIGWVGTGRMGFSMVSRLLQRGCNVAVYNRTRAKAEPLTDQGASIVNSPSELADRDIVFTMVAGSDDFIKVVAGKCGVLSRADVAPKILIDCTSVSQQASAKVRDAAEGRGVGYLAAPVSGNAKVVKAGKLSIVASGPPGIYDEALPYLEALGAGATYVGEGEASRIVKFCHNMLLGVVTQSLAEITVLAEKSGVSRNAFLDFLNKSVMGSVFSRYKTPAFVNLDFSVTFTPELLCKDLDLGLSAARNLGVPMPVAAHTRELVQTMIGHGMTNTDFSELLTLQALASGIDLEAENVDVDDGLQD